MMKYNIKKIKNQKGVILVMAMMILTLMMGSVLALARIIMGEINMTRNIDNSIVAFYTAESGIEKALYYVKYSGENNNFDFFTSLENQEDFFEDDYEREIKIVEASTEAEYWSAYNIKQEEVTHVNIINPDGGINVIAHDKDRYKVEWEIEDCQNNISKRLEITLEYFENNFTDPGTKKHLVTCSSCNENLCRGDGTDSFESSINQDKYYLFSFNALREGGDYISNLEFTAWKNSVNDSEGILSEISIKTEGTYRNSVQHLQARLPALGSVSDIFSYVIFSGEDLEKS